MLKDSLQTSSRTQLDPSTACATGATEALPFDFKTPKGQDLGHVIINGSVGAWPPSCFPSVGRHVLTMNLQTTTSFSSRMQTTRSWPGSRTRSGPTSSPSTPISHPSCRTPATSSTSQALARRCTSARAILKLDTPNMVRFFTHWLLRLHADASCMQAPSSSSSITQSRRSYTKSCKTLQAQIRCSRPARL